MVEEDRLRGRDLDAPGVHSSDDSGGATVRSDDYSAEELDRVGLHRDVASVTRSTRFGCDEATIAKIQRSRLDRDVAAVRLPRSAGADDAPGTHRDRVGDQGDAAGAPLYERGDVDRSFAFD